MDVLSDAWSWQLPLVQSETSFSADENIPLAQAAQGSGGTTIPGGI